METIEEIKEKFIVQTIEDSQSDFDTIQGIFVEVIERVFHYAYDLGYDKGFFDRGNLPEDLIDINLSGMLSESEPE
jgi:hypothetical protein